MPISFIKISTELYRLPFQGLYQVSIFALIYNFNGKGLRQSNGNLANALSTDKRTIERAIASLKKRGYIKDTGKGKNDRCLVLCTDKLSVLDTGKMSAGIPTIEVVSTDKTADHNKGKNTNKDYLSECFTSLWSKYPKKTARADAKKAFNKLNPDKGLFDTIMTALARHKQTESWQKEKGKYIPKLANWLKDERWKDELSELDDCGIVQTQDCDPAEAERLRVAMKEAGY